MAGGGSVVVGMSCPWKLLVEKVAGKGGMAWPLACVTDGQDTKPGGQPRLSLGRLIY